ncbi:Uncharacterised protein [Mycobacterium tuberculosis]|nr:Uncharacterised protein [Mycobacterium tuberculosis]SGF31451.1 Uncharacterised protein [Mycobacterium tuberculosis]SGH40466.1 Uncharacterised protein [Mycobacterium tuberculosis]SGK69129.1 Uncharacterised protein [Mycobacterium tuberculosis]SGN11389.1 Uncharacterised protein [Mycobacterium tuberculosis]
MPVSGQFVTTYPEHCAQRPGQRQEETAVAADAFRRPRHSRAGTIVAVVPPLGRLGATPGAHHPAPTQPDLCGGLVNLRITTGGVTRNQPRIILRRRQQISGAQVSRPHPLLPRHPIRRQQCGRPRDQHHLADRGMVRTGIARHHDGPLPSLVARQMRDEPVGGGVAILVADAQVVSHRLRAAELHNGGPGLVGRTPEHRR